MATLVNTKTAPNAFLQYLNRNVTVALEKSLHTKLGITANKLTRIKKDPAIAGLDEARAFALFLNVKPLELVNNYGFGLDGMTARQLRQLEKESLQHSKI